MSELDERLSKGVAHKIAGEYDAALAELEAALALGPDCAQARHELGLVLGFIGEFDRSVEELKRAADLAPTDVQILLDLGLTYAMVGMSDEAKATFEAVLAIDPGNKTAEKNLSYFE